MRKRFSLISRLLLLPFFLAPLFLLSSHVNSQPTPETWGDLSIQPTISSGQLHSVEDHEKAKASHRSYFGGKTCNEATFSISNSSPITACWYENEAGYFIDGGAIFVPRGNDQARIPKDYEFSIFPTWYEDVVLVKANDGSYAEFRHSTSLSNALIIDPDGNEPNYYNWSSPANLRLTDSSGRPYNMSNIDIYSQVVHSEDGRWLLLFDNDGLLIRIDLENMTVSSFDAGKQYDGDYWAATAISSSGRYIAAYEYGYDFIIIDTKSCAQNAAFVDESPVANACSTRSIKDYVWENFSDFGSIFPQFYGDDVLRIHGINDSSEALEQIIQAPNTTFPINYIALGDSYTSGEGAYGYFGSTNEANNRCHLARTAYPFILNRLVTINSTQSVACSGAVINDIADVDAADDYEFQNTKPTDTNTLGVWAPGYSWQLDHIKRPGVSVNVVTVGIGGNDIGFGDIIKKCVGWGDCFDNFTERFELAMEIQGQFYRLATLFSEIRSAVLEKSPNGRVFAIGYPQIAAKDGECKPNVFLSNNEIVLSHEIITYLNSVIRSAAARAGISFVSVEDTFRGHRLCEDTSTTAMNGLGIGNGTPIPGFGPFANESFHPTPFGHLLLARDITARTNKLFRPLPIPNENAIPPTFLKTPLVLNATDIPKGLRKRVFEENLSADVVIKGSVQTVSIYGKDRQLLGNSRFEVSIHSEPTFIGSYTSDVDGNLSFSYIAPLSLPAGFHTIHIVGKNADLENIDLYKTVYFAHSYHDMDGNGLNDKSEPCGLLEEFGIDEDRDGIDDGCDNLITKPKNVTETQLKLSDTADKMSRKSADKVTLGFVQGMDDASSILEVENPLAQDSVPSGDSGSFTATWLVMIVALVLLAILVVRAFYTT